jgi:diguanylate cyclase (GGDEF)-like protein/PAS domain S-box-containing protein
VGFLVFERIVNEANDAVIVAEIDPAAGPGFRIAYVNAAFTRVFGYTVEQALGQSPRILQGPDTCADTVREISAVVHGGASIRRRILNYTRAGQPLWVDVNIVPLPSPDGDVRRFAAIERDVSSEVQREAQLEKLAYGDPLTKLANRRFFDQMLGRELSRAHRFGLPLSLAILDVDHFKMVNDTWGHPIGDRILVAVARSILQSVRSYDCIARIGGEEFAVLLPGADLANGKRVIERLCADIHASAHVMVGAETVAVTCSAGLTALKDQLEAGDELMRRADNALYAAKNAGRNRIAVLAPGDSFAATEELSGAVPRPVGAHQKRRGARTSHAPA